MVEVARVDDAAAAVAALNDVAAAVAATVAEAVAASNVVCSLHRDMFAIPKVYLWSTTPPMGKQTTANNIMCI